MKRSFWKLY